MYKWSTRLPLWSTVSLFLMLITLNVSAYNLSPKPNQIIKDPQLVTPLPKLRASYFGFTISLRSKGVIVGAPRAQSTLEAQRNVNETGAIYKCSLANGACAPYVFDRNGNVNIESSEYLIESGKRDFQWLGAAMDGGTKDTDKLLVCAPRFVAPTESDYHLHGICYWVKNTLGDSPENVTKISPLLLKQDQVKEDNNNYRYYNYILAEQGLSAHVSDDNEEFLIGAPGIHTWKGSVIRYRQKNLVDDPIASRRDTTSNKSRKTRQDSSSGNSVRVTYESDVLRPELWNQPDDSYFGYGVGSGRFDSTNPQKLLYVATAPQANEQSGEAYIFDIRGVSITKHFVFRGSQFGEYFGYSVLADDLNGDGLTDVVVSAPQYAHEDSHDNGAIYVFINRGNFNFDQILLKSPLTDSARFGTTLSRLGDINHDGFNDIAVGAPFADNGTVFVYLGSEKGIREQHSQRLNSPQSVESKYGTHMFGHGLSKGSDIDDNGFNDLAVGAPNAEALFLYRAYPVVKVVATVKSTTREITPDQTKFKLTACYGIETTSDLIKQQDLAIRLVVDPQVKRVKFTQTQTNEMSFNTAAGTRQECREFDCDVRYSIADIFKPIELEMHYNVVNQIPDSEVFCETCAAVDPADPKVFTEKIIFSTGCVSICVADLKLTSSGFSSDYIIGSSNTLKVNYEITNSGETAYLPQINITTSNRMNFAKIPSNCKVTNSIVMVCDLNRGQPMGKGSKDSIAVIFDVSSIMGQSMTISAEVYSTGLELSSSDNVLHDVITLKEFTEVEVSGSQTSPQINLEHYKKSAEIVNNYEIRSNGPSNVGAMEVVFYIPVAYKVGATTVPIVDVSNITLQAVYDKQLVNIDLVDSNNTQLLMQTVEMSTRTGINHVQKTIITKNNINYDVLQSGHVHEVTILDSDSVATASMTRRRRSRREVAALTATRDQYALITNARAHELLSEDFKGKLPVNRTIVFNCRDHEMTSCVRAVIRVHNFKPEKPLTVSMRYNVNLDEVNQVLIEPWEFFVVLIDVGVTRVSATAAQSLVVVSHIDPNIISKHQMSSTPIWVIILAVLGGLLLLALITYGMYRLGFFKRATKEEMDKLVHQGQVEPEAENLNSDNN